MRAYITFVGLFLALFVACSEATALEPENSFSIGLAGSGAEPFENNEDYAYFAGTKAVLGKQTYHIQLRQQKDVSKSGSPEIYIRPENSPIGVSISSDAAMVHYSQDLKW